MKATNSAMNALAEKAVKRALVALAAIFLAGCGSLLPSSQRAQEAPWKSFAEARAAFDQITPPHTKMEDLGKLGFDPFQTPNITILSYADIRRRFAINSLTGDDLDPDLRDCLAAREACKAYESDQKHVDRHRTGNFWLDFLDFRRHTDITGWRFNAIIVLKNDRVVYKLWSGQPSIKEVEDDHNPLGPLQGSGSRLISY